MARVGTAYVDVEANLAPFKRELSQNMRSLAGMGAAAGGSYGRAFSRSVVRNADAVTAAIDRQQQSLQTLTRWGRRAAVGGGILAGLGVKKAISDGIRFNATMESNTVALSNFLGSTKQARGLLSDLFETAKKTPFQFADITRAARQFQAFGFSVNQTKRYLDAVGNAVAGLGGGADEINRVVLAFGQMQSKGKVMGQELLQLTEVGIPAYRILKDELNLTSDEVRRIGTQGIESGKAIEALTKGMQKRFGDAARLQAKTFEGQWSTMKDNWAQTTGAMTEGLFQELKEWAPVVNRTLEDITRIFNRKDLNFEEKMELSRTKIRKNLQPLIDEIERADLPEKLGEAFSDALPVIFNVMGKGAGGAAKAFVKGWLEADIWGKLITAGFLLSKMGGFPFVGKKVAGKFAERFASTAAADLAAATATEGALGTAVAGKKAQGRWKGFGRIGGKALGAGLIAGIVLGFAEWGDDLRKEIEKLTDDIEKWFEDTLDIDVENPIWRGFDDEGSPAFRNFGPEGRRGGRLTRRGFRRFQQGGLVPAMVSPGELLAFPDGSSAQVPGRRTHRDSVFAPLPVGTAVFTGHGQSLLAQGASPAQALKSQMPHFQAGGQVKPGVYSSTSYGPPWGGINGTGVTRTGVNLKGSPHVYGIAVDPRMIPLGSRVGVWPNPFDYRGAFRAFDTGGAIKGARIDFYDWRGRGFQMGWGRRKVRVSASTASARRPSGGGNWPKHLTAAGRRVSQRGIFPGAFADAFEAGRAGRSGRGVMSGIFGAVRDALPDMPQSASGRTPSRSDIPGVARGAPAKLRAIAAKAASISSRNYSYRWGGGHNAAMTGPYDCSGAVSAVLSAGGYGGLPRTSGGLMSWGQGGKGKYVTLYTGPRHVFMRIGRRYFGTSGQNPGGGANWIPSWPGMPAGGVYRHPKGLRKGGVVGLDKLPQALREDPFIWAEYQRTGLLPGFRAGGVAGAFGQRAILGTYQTRVGALPTQGNQAARQILTEYADDIDTLSIAQLRHQVRNWRRAIRQLFKGGVTRNEAAQIARMRGGISLIAREAGLRAGRFAGRADEFADRRARMESNIDLAVRGFGLEGSAAERYRLFGPQGLRDQRGQLLGQRANLRRALKVATRSGNKTLATELRGELDELQQEINENVIQRIEGARELIRLRAQERVDARQFKVDVANAELGLFDAGQRVSGTQGTAAGLTARAGFIRDNVVPALQGMLPALQKAYGAALKTNDVAGARSIWLQILGVQEQIQTNTADANALLQQALEAATELAGLSVDTANIQFRGLELDQKLAGTFDTQAGREARAAFITNTLIPGMQAQMSAIQAEFFGLLGAGDWAGAVRKANEYLSLNNDIKQLQLDAKDLLTVIAENTEQTAQALADLLKEEVLLWKQRFNVSQAQYGVLSQFPYGGSFADGGTVPGPIGAPRTVIAHGGETISPAGGPSVQVIVHGTIYSDRRDPIEVLVDGKVQNALRNAARGRALPGASGGLIGG